MFLLNWFQPSTRRFVVRRFSAPNGAEAPTTNLQAYKMGAIDLQYQDLLEHELPLVERLVREAGALVRTFYENGVEVTWKGVNDPVTAADHAAKCASGGWPAGCLPR